MIMEMHRAEGKVDPFEMPTEEQNMNEREEQMKIARQMARIPCQKTNSDRSQLQAYSELVNHPDHYNTGKIEVIDAIQDWELDFIEGNVVKYVARSRHKSSRVGDLKKARWYLDYLIKQLEGE
jgi:hypothetical protein